jgi:hypothetical protein
LYWIATKPQYANNRKIKKIITVWDMRPSRHWKFKLCFVGLKAMRSPKQN